MSTLLRVKRFLLFLFPALVFVVALTAPGGDYVFRAGPLGEVEAGELPQYVSHGDGVLYLYSSPFGVWSYPRAVAVELFYPTVVYVNSTCGVASGVIGGAVGRYYLDLHVPPKFEGDCIVNFTARDWRRAITVRVKLVDWYPGASERAVVVLNGSGWQFIQVDQDGWLYIWERPLGMSPLAGCVFVYNNSILIAESLRYRPVQPDLLPQSFVPSEDDSLRYGAFLYLNGVGTLYIYPMACPPAFQTSVKEPPRLVGKFGVLQPSPRGVFFDAAVVNDTVFFHTNLRSLNYSVAVGNLFLLHVYTYSTPVDMWGAVLRYDFRPNVLLTTEVSFFKPHAVELERFGDLWLYNVSGVHYWVYGPRPHYVCSLPCVMPVGWTEPMYIVVDSTRQWGGWPQIVSVRREVLRPWP